MPKGHRSSRSQPYNRLSPINTPTTSYFPNSARTIAPSNSIPVQLQHNYYTPIPTMNQYSYSTGGPVQHPMASYHPQHLPMPQPVQPPPLSSIRPSSGAWNPQDDATLMAARAQGMNWAPLQQSYFPSKTPNACRKRHERLMERRSADDWDQQKLENLAKHYMDKRKEIWAPLASATGEKWLIVEAKCLALGLKNLQASSRSAGRRERLLDTTGRGYNGDDSAVGLDDGEDLGDDYADAASEHSGGSGAYYGHQSHGSASSTISRHSVSGGYRAGDYSAGGGYGQRPRGPSQDMGIKSFLNQS